jgi:uncharacterized membrane protein YfcA
MSKKSWLYCSGGVLAFIGSVILLYDQTLWPVGVLLQVVGLLLILGTRKHNAKLAEQLPRDTTTKGWLIVIPAMLTAVGVTAVASS